MTLILKSKYSDKLEGSFRGRKFHLSHYTDESVGIFEPELEIISADIDFYEFFTEKEIFDLFEKFNEIRYIFDKKLSAYLTKQDYAELEKVFGAVE